jgi:serine/threonine-protein kinase
VAEQTRYRAGDLVAGKYRVERVLGAGGMGVVLAAHHVGLDKMVAVKFLLPEMLAHQDVVGRFAREARAAARITSEHVARVFDVGTLEDGAPYLVMEFLDGIDLSKWLKDRGPLPTAQAVDFLLQGCEAVGEAHGLGIVHRDLKPANLFWTRRADGGPCIKVLDFGISKFSGLGDRSGSKMSFTRTAALVGTPFYMSPEQMESSKEVDGRSDVWALGVILFELLTDTVPFGGATLPEVCVKIATHSPPRIRSIRPDVPEGIEIAILRCLEKNREKRFDSVTDFASALAPFGTELAAESATRMERAKRAASGLASATVPSPLVETQRPPMAESFGAMGHTKAFSLRRRTALLGAIGGAVVLGASAVGFSLVAGQNRTGSASASANSVATPPAAAPSVAPARTREPISALTATQERLRALEDIDRDAAMAPSPDESTGPSEPARRLQVYGPKPQRLSAPEPAMEAVKPSAGAKAKANSPGPPRTNAEPASGSSAFDERL